MIFIKYIPTEIQYCQLIASNPNCTMSPNVTRFVQTDLDADSLKTYLIGNSTSLRYEKLRLLQATTCRPAGLLVSQLVHRLLYRPGRGP